ncbi:uncharacterized protein TNCV_3812891 [Trichonephila clavipes]|nr:uncharacterized protein TNCV_3812891 [Trichonephila clavipes]
MLYRSHQDLNTVIGNDDLRTFLNLMTYTIKQLMRWVHQIVECVVQKGTTRGRHFCLPLSTPNLAPKEKPVRNAVKGLKECEIELHNPFVFSEHDFSAAKTTNHDVISDATKISSANPQTLVVENQYINPPEKPEIMKNIDSDAPKKPIGFFLFQTIA